MRAFRSCGIFASLWLLFGVALTATYYPGYSHIHQAMSELGAAGAPTQTLTPLLNHFPLTILFVLFGASVVSTFRHSRSACWSGGLIVAHGVFTLLAGVFPCDFGCNPVEASVSQLIHNAAGALMFLSLLLANAIWIAVVPGSQSAHRFRRFSQLCLVLAIVTFALLGNAMTSGDSVGLYQRLNYGVSLVWLAGLSLLMRRESI